MRIKNFVKCKQLAVACGLVVGLTMSASATINLNVVASSAPNASGSPSWAGYTANAMYALENDLSQYGNRSTDPKAYEAAGAIVAPGDFMVTTFKSWRGVINPAAPFNNELGNRMHFGLHAVGDGITQFKLSELTFAIHSSDPGDGLVFTGDFIGYDYNGTTRFGINWGADRIKGTDDDVKYTSGNGTTLVDELVYVGVGNAFWPGGDDANPGNPAGGAQAAMDDSVNWIYSMAPFTITGSYSIQGVTASDTVMVPVPEPSTYIAGAMLLLPFGASMVRRFRQKRTL